VIFLNIALFISFSETSIDLQVILEVGHRHVSQTQQQHLASGGCD
jgi:hypothetical protein